MNGFKKCSNGHFYKEDLNACPYCPGGNAGSTGASGADDLGKTMVTSVNPGGGSNEAKTEVLVLEDLPIVRKLKCMEMQEVPVMQEVFHLLRNEI